jgi:hypothetical protein
MTLEIIDNSNGKRIVVARKNMGDEDPFEGYDAHAVLWNSDSRRFAFLYGVAIYPRGIHIDKYSLQLKPLSVRETNNDRVRNNESWIKSEVLRRAKHGSHEQSALAKKLLQMDWESDWSMSDGNIKKTGAKSRSR